MNTTIKDSRARDLQFFKENQHSIVIDADTHVSDLNSLKGTVKERYNKSDNYYQGRPISAEDLLQEMKLAAVDVSLIWQNPAATDYSEDKKYNFESLYKANRYISDTANAYPNRFVPAGWTDPKALGMEKALELAEICVEEFGFPIVKLNPAQNAFPLDSENVFTVFEKVIEMGAIPAFHYGADTPFTPPEGLAKLAERFRDHKLIAVHMGGGGAGYIEADPQYTKSRELGLAYSNINYVLSAKRDTHIESDLITYQLAGTPFNNNLFCASDAPYGRQTWNFGGFRWMFKSLQDNKNHTDKRVRDHEGLFNEAVTQNYMGKNFAALVIEGYERILSR